jgi:hypothetical protein
MIRLKGDDKRYQEQGFHHYAKVAKDGSVLAIVEVVAGAKPPTDGEGHEYVDVSTHYPLIDHAEAVRTVRGR